MENFKDLHIGTLIYECVNEQGIEMSRICRFLHSTENEILEMYSMKSLDVDILLKWSKLLKYDFFRLYSNHLILYAPIAGQNKNAVKSKLPQFRKSLYTKEIIDFMMELLENKQKTTKEIINQYGIPKSTLNKWISKYSQ